MQKAANPTGSLTGPLLCPPSLVTDRIAGDFNWAFHVQLSNILLRYAILYKEIMSHWSFLSSIPFEGGWIIATLSSTPVIYIHNPTLNNNILMLYADLSRAFSNTIAYPRGWVCRSQWAITRLRSAVSARAAVSIGAEEVQALPTARGQQKPQSTSVRLPKHA